jgi:two-component system cell cycle response regulator
MPYPRPPLVAIVTGQEWTSLSMTTIFSPRGFATLRVFTGQQALQRIREASVDMLIVDRELKDMSGCEFCQQLQEIAPHIPVVLLSTGSWEREAKLQALQCGAWDVCSLPLDGEELFMRVDRWVRVKLHSDAIAEKSLLDPNTGVYNVQGMLRRIAELGAGAVRHERPLACVVVGAYSPSATLDMRCSPEAAAGMLASVLRSMARAADAIGRLNETEFVVMAPDTDPRGAAGLAERLRDAAEHTALVNQFRYRIRVGCYGVANMRDASIAPNELLMRAAEDMQHAGGDMMARLSPTVAKHLN